MSATVAADSALDRISSLPNEKSEAGDFAWRVLQLLNVFRLFIASVLLLTFVLVADPPIIGGFNPNLASVALGAMLALGIVEIPLLKHQWPGPGAQTYFQFAFDLVVIIALMHASGGVSSGLGGLLIVSVGTLALLVPTDRALLLAAVTTLALLGEQFMAQLQGVTTVTEFAPAGILGAVIFVITGVVQLLRNRIVETEALAEQRGVDLANLVELNDYIIQHLRESIVVVDADDTIRLINESAINLLHAPTAVVGTLLADTAPGLMQYLKRWRAGEEHDFSQSTIVLGDDGTVHLQPHFAHLGPGRSEGVVIFLEDTTLIAERVQQTKLAALGRLSASIAHEIRNPLGALSHAGQLLAESADVGPEEHRLTDIIRVNSRRVNRIVDSVLALSRSDKLTPERIELKQWARDFADEFTRTQELYEGTVSVDPGTENVEIEMDRTHLHQVLWNLCDNAVKYASQTAGAISVEISCGHLEASGRPYLNVADRGPGVEADKVDQIFEPFYTGQKGGTGLGLYISRELCERNRATLRYHPRTDGGSVFRIVFPDPKRWHR